MQRKLTVHFETISKKNLYVYGIKWTVGMSAKMNYLVIMCSFFFTSIWIGTILNAGKNKVLLNQSATG